jgi:hypothetical protein
MTKKDTLWLIWDLSGFRFIWNKIRPEKDVGRAAPSSFLFWIITIYLGLYSIASSKYESSVASYDQGISTIYIELSIPELKQLGINKIAALQKTRFYSKPSIVDPIDTLKTVFFKSEIDPKRQGQLKTILKHYKKELNNSYFDSIDFSYFDGLSKSNFSNSNLNNAKFVDSNLIGSNFSNAKLTNANFAGAQLSFAKFQDANMKNANFVGSTGIDFDTFQNVYSLKGAQLPMEIETELKENGRAFLFNVD